MKTIIVILCLCICCVHTAVKVTPAVVEDSFGNYADENSNIVYAPIPTGDEYVVDPGEYSYNGLLPLIKGMQGFVHIAFGKTTPWETFLGLISGTAAFGTDLILSMAKWGGGYAACVVIGLLFFLIFPIVGCCFCCCRTCCGNCGGKMVQKRNDSTATWRACYIITLFLSCTFLGCGTICTYVVNDRMTTLFSDVAITVNDNVADLDRYGNNTLMQVNYVAITGYNFTAKVMLRDINNIGPIVGGAVQTSFDKEAGINEAFDQLLTLDPLLKSLVDGLTDVESKKTAVFSSISGLETAMTAVATAIDNTFATCGVACDPKPDTGDLNSGSSFDPNNMPNFTTELNDLKNVQNTNITALVLDGKKEFNNITEIVADKAAPVTQTITDMINSFDDVIADALSSVNDMLSIFDTISNLTDTIGNLGEMSVGPITIDQLESYRWMGGLGLTCFVLVIFVLQLLGLILGCCACCCCGDKNSLPTERGGVGNCAGLLLMASVGIVIIFGALIMLLVWVTYLVGAPLEQLVCTSLRDPEYTIFTTLLDGGDPADGPHSTLFGEQNGYTLGKMVFDDDTVPLTIAGLLTACDNDAPAWNALFIDRFFSIDAVLDYKSTIDVDGEIDKISVDLSNLNILDNDTKTQLVDMKDAITTIDFNGMKDELAGKTVEADFSGLAKSLQEAADKIESQPLLNTVHAELLDQIAELNRIETDELVAVKTAQDNMLASVRSMNATAINVPNQIDTLVATLEKTQTELQINGVDIIKNESKLFAYRVLGIADQFVGFVNDSLRNQLGKCKPVSNMYQSILINTLCGSIIDSWNCVWFSLGWCLFFMVFGIILSTKLAKHVRKMNELHPDDHGSNNTYGPGKGKVHPI